MGIGELLWDYGLMNDDRHTHLADPSPGGNPGKKLFTLNRDGSLIYILFGDGSTMIRTEKVMGGSHFPIRIGDDYVNATKQSWYGGAVQPWSDTVLDPGEIWHHIPDPDTVFQKSGFGCNEEDEIRQMDFIRGTMTKEQQDELVAFHNQFSTFNAALRPNGTVWDNDDYIAVFCGSKVSLFKSSLKEFPTQEYKQGQLISSNSKGLYAVELEHEGNMHMFVGFYDNDEKKFYVIELDADDANFNTSPGTLRPPTEVILANQRSRAFVSEITEIADQGITAYGRYQNEIVFVDHKAGGVENFYHGQLSFDGSRVSMDVNKFTDKYRVNLWDGWHSNATYTYEGPQFATPAAPFMEFGREYTLRSIFIDTPKSVHSRDGSRLYYSDSTGIYILDPQTHLTVDDPHGYPYVPCTDPELNFRVLRQPCIADDDFVDYYHASGSERWYHTKPPTTSPAPPP